MRHNGLADAISQLNGFFRRCAMATETAASKVGVVTALRSVSRD